MEKNLELLRETLDFIKSHPSLHNQGAWVDPATDEACGTSMCFAGHAAVLAGGTFEQKYFKEHEEWNVEATTGKHVDAEEAYDEDADDYFLPPNVVHVSTFAERKLGLNDEERSYLFAGHRTLDELEDFVSRYEKGERLFWGVGPTGYYEYMFKSES